MDYLSMAFYGAVCGLLALAAPELGGRLLRLALGAVVGLVAAALLPLLHAGLGY